MADIFISYASEDRSRAELLAKALEEQDWTVFWDRTIPPGKSFDQVIEEAITAAKCVVVLWSKKSIKSDWVKEEANIGKRRQILVPAKIDSVNPPIGFGLIQAADLTDWATDLSHAGFSSFLGAISEIAGPSPLKVKAADEKRAEEEHRLNQEKERKLLVAEHKKAEEERQRLEKEIQRLADEKRKFEEKQKIIESARKAEEERQQEEAEAKREADDEKRRKKKEGLKRETEEEERKRKEAEAKQKAEEEQKRREVKAEIKTDKPKSVKIKPSEPHKKSNALKIGVLAGVIVLLITGVWLYYKNQQEQQKKETRIKLERFYEQVEELERSAAQVDNQEQLKGLYRQRDKLSKQVAAFSEQATKVGHLSQLEQLQDRLKQIQIQLAKKEKELIAARKGRIFVESLLDNATVKFLNIDQDFQQGMELEPGKYHVQVSSEGYEPQDIWIRLGPGEEKRISFELEEVEAAGPISPHNIITNSVGMKFVLIPAGSFAMGSQLGPEKVARKYGGKAEWYKNEQPPHTVEITKPFYLQTTEVSQGQWKRIMGYNPSRFKDCGDDCPVEQVSWDMAQEFISKLNQLEGTHKYRLSNEAEWEYACRAETETAYSFGNEVDTLGEYAWYSDNSEDQTHPVGGKKPNPWGLYDMHGNVWEWCQDWYGGYPSKSVVDPKGPDKRQYRVLRGGSWGYYAWSIRSAIRYWGNPDRSNFSIGFRVARDF